jgi:hypothetical protein
MPQEPPEPAEPARPAQPSPAAPAPDVDVQAIVESFVVVHRSADNGGFETAVVRPAVPDKQ